MSRLQELYLKAIEQTKQKVEDDLDKFLGSNENILTYEEYLEERQQYIDQIWINIWLNITNNDVPRKEKKQFLSERGYEVEAVDKKYINKLFRNEMRTESPFDVRQWLSSLYDQEPDEWNERYSLARMRFLKEQKEAELAEQRRKIQNQMDRLANTTIIQCYEKFYLRLRYFVACQLENDFQTNPKYTFVDVHKIEEKLTLQGALDPTKYRTVANFFHELTGNVHKTFQWEYETYFSRYESLVRPYLSDLMSKTVFDQLPETTISEYKEQFEKELTPLILKDILQHYLYAMENDFLERIKEEYIEHLLALAKTCFDETEHKKIYFNDIAERERLRAQELEEIERKKLEEERMIDDIFGREYSPSTGRNIRYILHIGETNTGKTHHALKTMAKAASGLYLAPLRLLALEVYDKLNKEGVACGLKTGEEEKDLVTATHISSTVEMFYEKSFYDCIVIDEAQMIADKDRGFSWYKAITKANANEVHIIGSRNSKEMVVALLGDSEIEIYEYSRDIPLQVEKNEFQLRHTKKGDALVCFSRRKVLETASKLENDGYAVSMIYGSMPPETRKKQMERFIRGDATVIVATDAIGMGLNLPIRRIVFLDNEKFDGTRRRKLTSQEVKQIAGRAGRKGIYNVGKVAFTKDIKQMSKLLDKEDILISTFAIAPTSAVFERFQKYYRELSKFFELWFKFESPKGTKKASLSEERELYATIRDSEIEARLSMMELYGFLHLPFSKKEPELIKQWRDTMFAIVRRKELPEPAIQRGSLEELELSYKAIGLHLLFLYRLDRGTEAIYWERLRMELSDEVHDRLGTDVKNLTKKCKQCGKILPWDFAFQSCDACHQARRKKQFMD